MKFFITLTVSMMAFAAQAETYTCLLKPDRRFVLRLSDTAPTGEVFHGTKEKMSRLQGEVSVDRSGGIVVAVIPKQPDIDWSRRGRTCFVWGNPTTRISIDKKSELLQLPHVIVRPGARNCSIPRPLARPLPLSCRLTKGD